MAVYLLHNTAVAVAAEVVAVVELHTAAAGAAVARIAHIDIAVVVVAAAAQAEEDKATHHHTPAAGSEAAAVEGRTLDEQAAAGTQAEAVELAGLKVR